MAGRLLRAPAFLWFWFLTLGCLTVNSGQEYNYLPGLSSPSTSGSVFTVFGANSSYLDMDVLWLLWSTEICMQTMVPQAFKQKLLIDPVNPKFSKSKFRYYANTDASYNIELNPGPITTQERTLLQITDSTTFCIPARITQRLSYSNQPYRLSRYANPSNLFTVPRTPYLCTSQRYASKNMRLCLLNARSIRNKTMIVKEFVEDNNIDLLVLTETWLRPKR